MDQNQSESYIESHRARSFFLPSWQMGALYIIFGAIILALYNYKSIFNWFGSSYVISGRDTKPTINVLHSNFSHSFSTAFGGRLGQVIFWSFVGAAAYILLWFARNLIYSFENDVIVDHYLHPTSYSRIGYWGSAFSGKVFFAAMLVVAVVYSFFTLKVIYPAAGLLARVAAEDLHAVSSYWYLLLAVLLAAFVLYAAFLIGRIIRRLWGLL